MKPHQKSLSGALIGIALCGIGIIACAEKPDLLPRASFREQHAQARATDLFPCRTPYHHDGDAIRCGSKGRSDRLYAIDAPEMPGACRHRRKCTSGDPITARDHLRPDSRKSGRVPPGRFGPIWTKGRPVLRRRYGPVVCDGARWLRGRKIWAAKVLIGGNAYRIARGVEYV